jgi:hypothetical protein
VRLRDTRGLHYLAQLLQHPGHEFHATDLVGQETTAEPRPMLGDEVNPRADLGDAGAVLDAAARDAYRVRLRDLRDGLGRLRGEPDRPVSWAR